MGEEALLLPIVVPGLGGRRGVRGSDAGRPGGRPAELLLTLHPGPRRVFALLHVRRCVSYYNVLLLIIEHTDVNKRG